ncbi:MAG: hypothetical protein JJE09_04500 [Bacteroidia bacterium]|nr:hypothetical protein [Bacteroidia bacterium]
MQEKKNRRLLISFIAMTVLTICFYFLGSPGSQMTIDTSLFKPKDGSKINHITLESGDRKVALDFDGTRWMLNNKYEADGQLIKLLFATLEKAEPKRPVANNQLDSINSMLSRKGVIVNIFGDETLVQSFTAGGNAQKTEAYFRKATGQPPYLMAIPGYRYYVSYILELDEAGWRDKRIFNFNWRNFKNLKVIVSVDPIQNFEVSFKDNYFGIVGLVSIDTTKLNDYLDAVSLLSADQFINHGLSSVYDSLLKTQPGFRIEVSDISDKTYSLDLFEPVKNDPNVLGKLDDRQPVLFKRNDIPLIAKKKAFFTSK